MDKTFIGTIKRKGNHINSLTQSIDIFFDVSDENIENPKKKSSEELEDFTSIDFSDKIHLKKNMSLTIGGMITKIIKKYDRKNRPMAFFEMDCIGGNAEIIAFSDCFGKYEK